MQDRYPCICSEDAHPHRLDILLQPRQTASEIPFHLPRIPLPVFGPAVLQSKRGSGDSTLHHYTNKYTNIMCKRNKQADRKIQKINQKYEYTEDLGFGKVS